MFKALLVAAGLAALIAVLAACGSGLDSCEGLEGWVKDLSEDNPYQTGGSHIIKLYEIAEVSKTETRVDCTARAKLSNGGSVYISYYGLTDSDGDQRFGFSILR